MTLTDTEKWTIPLYKIYTDQEDLNLITKIISRGNKWAVGPEIEEFEYDEDVYIDPDEKKILNLARHIRHNTKNKYLIEPRTVRPRQRKVTVIELMSALKKAKSILLV